MTDETKNARRPPASETAAPPLRPWNQPVDATGAGGGDPVQRRIAGLFTRLEAPPAADPHRLARIRARLEEAVQPRSRRRPRGWIWAAAGALLLLSSGVVAAARGWVPQWISWSTLVSRQPSPVSRAVLPRQTHQTRQARPAAEPEPTEMIPSPSPSLSPLPAPTPSPLPAPTRGVTGGPAARAHAVGAAETEGALLETAVARLRRDRDPAGTLQILDRYDARFSRGALRGEATRLRVDALLLAEDRVRALALLQGLTLSNGGRDVELALIRGELLAAGGDCARALADFDRVSAAAPTGPLGGRAREGRADCERRRLDQAAIPPR
ncbi:MAG TPA: hypothetical protein VNO55_05675 [Polyangia bacterium]|nr:hypothetical protein [Polyangia bacterium]